MAQLDNPITGIDAGFRTPGNWVEAIFAQGPSVTGGGKREVVFVMPKTSAGTWTANTMYKVTNEQTAATGGGDGSPIHRAVRKFFSICKDATVWCLPYAATSGGSPVAATAVLTIATTATGAGTVSLWVCGELCQFTFATGDTATTIGAGIAAAVNAKSWLPCTANNVTGTVTLTAKIAGTSQGTASLGVIRLHTDITTGVSTTATLGGAFLGSGAAGAEGTTTEASNLATALATIAATRKYYVVTSTNTSTAWANLKTHLATKALPRQGLRSVGICGYTGSLATGQSLATGLNYERMAIAWQPNSEHDTAELAAALAAVRIIGNKGVGGSVDGEATDTAQNFNLMSLNGILLPAWAPSDYPTAQDVEDAITDGLTVITSSDSGAALIQSVTTRSKNSAGTSDDWRASRTSKVSVTDDFLDEWVVRANNSFGQKKLLRDELLADGTVNPNQKLIRNTVRPSMMKATLLKQVDDYYDAGKLDSKATIKDSIRVVASDAAPGRVEIGIDLRVIDWLDQTTMRLAEVSPG